MIVVVEGVDAAGKSTLCRNLKTMYGGEVYATPPAQFRETRKAVDRFAAPLESFRFYSASVELATQEILGLKESFGYLFVDRHWITTVATHKALGVDVDSDKLAELDCADLTILLTIHPSEQLRRFRERGMTTGDRNLLHAFHVVEENFRELVRLYCGRHFIINTTDRSPLETLQCATGCLNEYLSSSLKSMSGE